MTDNANSSHSTLIEARDICKRYGERDILQKVNLKVSAGRTLTLIGPNGAGKTTLVRILLGLTSADSGTVQRQPDLRIGYMPQRIQVQPTLPLTVQRFLQLARHQQAGAISETLELLRIAHLRRQQLIGVSGGEMQRVLLARALLNQPNMLILDEPAQGVDLSGQAELYRLITEIRAQRNCGVLMISHDLQLVMSSTDEVICLNHHICCHGEPETVSSHPAFQELFGTNIAPSLAVYTHHHNHKHDMAGQVKPADS